MISACLPTVQFFSMAFASGWRFLTRAASSKLPGRRWQEEAFLTGFESLPSAWALPPGCFHPGGEGASSRRRAAAHTGSRLRLGIEPGLAGFSRPGAGVGRSRHGR